MRGEALATLPPGFFSLPAAERFRQEHEMLRTALAERFGLKVHQESRDLPGLVLGVDKGGPRLPVSTPSQLLGSEPEKRHSFKASGIAMNSM